MYAQRVRRSDWLCMCGGSEMLRCVCTEKVKREGRGKRRMGCQALAAHQRQCRAGGGI